MAVGDKKVGIITIPNASYGAIQPPTTEEWTIHNIILPYGTYANLYVSNGTTRIQIDTGNSWLGYVFHLTNTHYLEIYNSTGSTLNVAYQGVQTK